MRIAICEDNKSEREFMTEVIRDWANIKNIKIDILAFNDAESFLFSWPIDIIVDLIFIDIKMRGMTGIELAETIRRRDANILIVYVTNYDQFILKGYEVNALHYLVKPISAASLIPILDKAFTIWNSNENEAIIVKMKNKPGKLKIYCGNIYYIKMDSHMAEIHTDTIAFETRKSTEELLEVLPSHFKQCHRSYIVNIFKISCLYDKYILLGNKERLPLSRTYSKCIKDVFLHLNRG